MTRTHAAPQPTDGTLIVRPATRSPSGFAFYGKWRDGTTAQVQRALGAAWVEPHGDGYRTRRDRCPEGALTMTGGTLALRDAIDGHEHDRIVRAAGGGTPTFGEVADRWLAWGENVRRWKPSGLRDARSSVSVHLRPTFDAVPITAIDRAAIVAWWEGLHVKTKTRGPLSERNANKQLSNLRRVLGYAADADLIPARVADRIKKHPERNSDRPQFLTPEQVAAVTRAARSDQDGWMFTVAAYTGLRLGEVVSLKVGSVDFARRTVHAIDNVSAGVPARVKDDEGRTVPMADEVAAVLARAIPANARPGDLVFPSPLTDGRHDPSALSRRYVKARDAAGLPPVKFHELRHTFGTLALDGGASLVQVQEWMGHADISTTRRYLHNTNRGDDAALLSRAFAPTPVPDAALVA